MDTFTLSLSSDTSVFETKYFPPLELNPRLKYYCGLIDFQTTNSIPNIDDFNNTFDYHKTYETIKGIRISVKKVTIPCQPYKIKELRDFIYNEIKNDIKEFDLRMNLETNKYEVYCSECIDFTNWDSIGKTFGFNRRKLNANLWHTADVSMTFLYQENLVGVQTASNKIHFGEITTTKEFERKLKQIIIPTGSYEIENIHTYLRGRLDPSVEFNLQVNIG